MVNSLDDSGKSPPKSHPWLTDSEREYILSGQQNQDIDDDGQNDEGYNPSTGDLLKHKQSWGVIIASAAIDPIWWLFVVWIPIYLNEVYGMDVKTIGIYGWVPYVGAMLGAWFGGLFAQNRLSAGWSVDKTRKVVITLGCVIMLPSLLAMANPGGPTAAVLYHGCYPVRFPNCHRKCPRPCQVIFSEGKQLEHYQEIAGMAAKLTAAGTNLSCTLVNIRW